MDNLIQYQDALLTIATRICKNSHLAKDIVQDVFLEGIESGATSFEELKKICLKKAGGKTYEKFTNPAYPVGGMRTVEEDEVVDFVFNLIPQEQSEEQEQLSKEEIESIAPTFKGKYLDFELAKAYIQKLDLRTWKDWSLYCRSGQKPKNIPTNPQIYPGFTTMHDWLGFRYFSYEEAKTYAQNVLVPQGVNSSAKFFSIRDSLPKEMPGTPYAFYASSGWVSWPDFLGQNRRSNRSNFLSYEEAKTYVQTHLVPTGVTDVIKYRKASLPNFIPAAPDKVYENKGWKDWGTYLGTGTTLKKNYIPYKEAREWVRLTLRIEGIVSEKKWKQYLKKEAFTTAPLLREDIPRNPCSYYSGVGSWVNWSDFLGVPPSKRSSKLFWDYTKARAWVIKNLSQYKLNSVSWIEYVRGKCFGLPELPAGVPKNPKRTYKNKGWKGFEDWLGYKAEKRTSKKNSFLSYLEAKKYVRKYLLPKGINSYEKYKKYELLPEFLPKEPKAVYKGKGWIGTDDFFSRPRVSERKALRKNVQLFSYEDARQYVQQYLVPKGIDTLLKYSRYKKELPLFLPVNPCETYKGKWKSSDDFFGTNYGNKKVGIVRYLDLKECRTWVQDNIGHTVKNKNDWKIYVSGGYVALPPIPLNVPVEPNVTYRKHGTWVSWEHFFRKVKPERSLFACGGVKIMEEMVG